MPWCISGARISAWLRVLAITVLLAVGAGAGWARAGAVLEDLHVERTDDGLFLYAQMQLQLPPLVEDALQKGIPIHFVAEAKVMRERWYWFDQSLASAERHMRIAYQPLTRRWRLNSSSEPISSADLGLSQQFESLDDTLAAVQRIAGWKIASAAELAGNGRQLLQFRFRLDASQLPRTFQLGAVGQGDWQLSLERRLVLPAESTP